MAITPSKTIFTKATSKALFRAVPRMVGLDGKSAYELAVANGFVGSEADWLASLEGVIQSLVEGENITIDATDPANPVISASAGGAVDSVNGKTGPVVLDADDIDDSSTTHKFASADQLSKVDGVEASADVTDAANVAAAGAFMKSSDDLDDITAGSTNKHFTSTEKTKLAGVETAADVTDATNVAAAGAVMDGDFSSNGLMVRTAAGTYTSRSVANGTGISVANGSGASGNPTVALTSGAQASLALADSATQPGDLAAVATSGDYDDLTNKPTLFSGDYDDLTDKPTLGALAAKSAVEIADIDATGTPSNTTYLRGDGEWATPPGSGGGGGDGTVTSVAVSLPTGLQASGSPITTSGTFAITYASGYAIPTTTKQGQWDTAYGWGNHASGGYLTTAAAAAAYQPLDSDLTTIAGLTATTNNFIVSVSGAWASRTPTQVKSTLAIAVADITDATANGRSLISSTNYASMRGLLDLEAGTDFYSISAANAAFAAASHTHTVSQLSDATANGRSLISSTNYASMRGLLDLEAGTDFYSISAANAAFQPLDADLTALASAGNSTVLAATTASFLTADEAKLDSITISEDLSADWQSGRGRNPNRVVIGETSLTAPDLAEINAESVIAIGNGAMLAATSAARAIAIGEYALGDVANVGFSNIAIGDFSLSHASGDRNIGIGTLAGHFISSGQYNTFVGRDAGHSVSSGTHNVGVGYRATAVGNNPVGLSGAIEAQYDNGTSTFRNVGVGGEVLSNVAGNSNTGFGDRAGRHVRSSDGNTYLGARAGEGHGYLISENDFALLRSVKTGTYSQSGTTISIAATAHGAVAGKKILVEFTSGAINTDTNGDPQWLVVASVPNANSLTLTSPVSKTASGNCSISIAETASSSNPGDYNTIIGFRSGFSFEYGSRNVLVGYSAGEGTGWGDVTYDDRLIIQNLLDRKPLIAGDFANGKVAVNAASADLNDSYTFAVHQPDGYRSFEIDTNGGFWVARDGFGQGTFSAHSSSAANVEPGFVLRRSRGTKAAPSVVQSGDKLGSIFFRGYDGSAYQNMAGIRSSVDGTPGSSDAPGRLEFVTVADGGTTLTERMRITNSGSVHFQSVGTTASAANAVLDNSASPANSLLRSTSSLAYKTDVEIIEEDRADAILAIDPIFYRSLAPADKSADGASKSFYSFGAEHLAEIDPRLVSWGYRDDDYTTVIRQDDESGTQFAERTLKESAELKPDGVNDRAVIAMLFSIVKRQDARLKVLENKLVK